MAHQPPFIVGYTWAASEYCPACIVRHMTATDRFDGWERSPRLRPIPTEDDLNEIAAHFGVDRADETTFDSDEFPKVINRQQIGMEPFDRTCDGCDVVLGDQEPHHVRNNIERDEWGRARAWTVRACYCSTWWVHV